MTPFIATPGYLSYGNIMHDMQRKKVCDVCKEEFIGTPIQKRHAKCAPKKQAKARRNYYIQKLATAPVVAVGSKWKLNKETFECTKLDGMYVIGMLHRSLKGPGKLRISRLRLHTTWIPLEDIWKKMSDERLTKLDT